MSATLRPPVEAQIPHGSAGPTSGRRGIRRGARRGMPRARRQLVQGVRLTAHQQQTLRPAVQMLLPVLLDHQAAGLSGRPDLEAVGARRARDDPGPADALEARRAPQDVLGEDTGVALTP